MKNCIFCKIIAGEAESSKVYEDDDILAFMDIQPVRQGQVLVIPKNHIDHFTDIPKQLAMKIYDKTHDIAGTIHKLLQPERVGLVVHGYGVPHAHMVIVPQEDSNDITTGLCAKVCDNEVCFDISLLPISPRNELDDMAEKLSS